ncbi:MAG TPA: bifunctional UDP-2,4-diacetamido-2,4,6-trideoxy-beta-L-altropyranose hydrolase/GNAT family N-acetyltransferase, partial [Pirellulales bacterium]
TLLAAGRAETLTHAHRFGDAFDETTLAADVPALAALASERDAAGVVLDGYHFTAADQAALAAAGRSTIVIDDLAGEPFYTADAVLNHNFGAAERTYPHGPLTLALLGERYLLLRPEFAPDSINAASTSVKNDASRPDETAPFRLLILFGGADAGNLTGSVLAALRGMVPTLAVEVVLGPANAHRAAIEREAELWGDRCRVLFGETNLSAAFRRADLALSAGGGTIWELAAVGTPTLAVITAENQRPGVERFAAVRAIENLGDAENVSPDELVGAVHRLMADASRREELSRTARSLVDGRGAERVVEALDSHLVVLRPATSDDAELLLDWANEPGVRAASFKSHTIKLDEHRLWLDRQLADPLSTVWIAYDLSGAPIGSVRFAPPVCQPFAPGGRIRPSTSTTVISVNVDATRRGQGWGPRIIQLATRRLLSAGTVRRVAAYIKTENVASQRAFVRAGYSFTVESSCSGFPAVVDVFDRVDLGKLAPRVAEAVL